jgi:hypothetical protein
MATAEQTQARMLPAPRTGNHQAAGCGQAGSLHHRQPLLRLQLSFEGALQLPWQQQVLVRYWWSCCSVCPLSTVELKRVKRIG